MKSNKLQENLEAMKQKIRDNIIVHDELVCGLCNELIDYAQRVQDSQGIAFAYVYRADHFYYVEPDVQQMGKDLEMAQQYIDENQPGKLLVKFYELKRMFFDLVYDIPSSFQYCLKTLRLAEQMQANDAILTSYGQIGSFFYDNQSYEDSLKYTEQALTLAAAMEQPNKMTLLILRLNQISCYLNLSQAQLAWDSLEKFNELVLTEEDIGLYMDHTRITVYTDRTKMDYYALLGDDQNVLHYYDSLMEHGVMKLKKNDAKEILEAAFNSLSKIRNPEKCEKVLDKLTSLAGENDDEFLLRLINLKIKHAHDFKKQELPQYYREYHTVYTRVQIHINALKVSGLQTKLNLNTVYTKQSESKKKIQELQKVVHFDSLTKVYNRRYMNLKQAEILNSQDCTMIGFAIFDVDYFKEYNDHYGHPAGDEVLRQVADSLFKNVYENMVVCRYGGDEFVCLCWNTDIKRFGEYVEKSVQHLAKKNLQHTMSRCADRVSLSVGYGCQPTDRRTEVFVLFEQVDEALYEAKRRGRNAIQSIERRAAKDEQ